MQHQFQQDFLGPTLDEVAASITSQFRGQLKGPSQPVTESAGRHVRARMCSETGASCAQALRQLGGHENPNAQFALLHSMAGMCRWREPL